MIKSHSVYYPLYNDKEHFIILITGGRGCEHPDTPVMMADMTVKKIKDICIGDYVMGDDGTPRCVLDTFRGNSELYRVHQNNAEDYIINDTHILTLKKSVSAKKPYGDVIDMPVSIFKNRSEKFQNNILGFKSKSIAYKEQEVLIDPYLLGLWLGDETSIFPCITNPDKEVYDWLKRYCDTHNQILSSVYKEGANRMRICGNGKIGGNDFYNRLREYNLIGNKHIPQCYIANSECNRLALLAGLLDTGGYFENGCYEITQKNKEIACKIKFIADTLGFRTSIKGKRTRYNGKDCGAAYRVNIGGDVWRIPCKVARKIAKKQDMYKNKDWLVSRLTIEPIGKGEWCGIMLNGNQRYLHADGTVTHNSGKSFSAGTFIERLTFEYNEAQKIAHKILYTRYTMVSAAISVIPEVLEKIDADGTTDFFKRTKTDIINKMTKSEIMFRGIHTSSGNQTAKLKSIHGVTTFVVDEAEEFTSYDDFERIMLSIRQKGLQNRIIIIMNPSDSTHWVYQKYIEKTHRIKYFDGVPVQISTHPNVLHIHTTYLDNIAHLSPQFLNEVLEMKEKAPERYAHVVMGRWSDVAEGAIFKHVGIVDKFPENAKHVALGMDFGYHADPTAIVKCGLVDNRLYLEEVCYKSGMLSTDIIKTLKPYADEGLFVYADSADPRLIDEIALGGIVIYGAQKGNGSILAGIDKMQTYEIFVTRNSVHLQEEFRKYVWEKDKDGNYINVPIDAFNHGIDASRYFVLGKLLGKIVKAFNKTKSDLGVY